MYKILSYEVSGQAPGWPGCPKLEIEPVNLIAEGDFFNAYNVKVFNHFGSHIDAPRHFNDMRPSISDLPLDRFIFSKPVLVNIPKTFKESVTAQELDAYKERIREADLLMIRSDFSVHRSTDPERYSEEGPAISSGACKYLMENYANLKGIALDWISLSSYANDDGKLAHEYLLSKFDRFVCIIEDINLQDVASEKIERVFAVPLLISGIDSSPVTVIAEMGVM